MFSRETSVAIWALIGLLFLCFPYLISKDTSPGRHRLNARDMLSHRKLGEVYADDKTASAASNSTQYNNFEDQTKTLETGHASYFTSRSLHELKARGDGPLYCTDGPCIDGSCCGPESICGYGPDFCGDGCSSQCNATAMCGQYSEDANYPCGMNLCCSATGWCGTTESYCGNADPVHLTLPCQAGYGSCQIIDPPSCGEGSGTTSTRKIGYYQSWNTRERKCNKVSPNQLNTDGYTHLFYAFASIDPASFSITPANSDDVQGMKDFTALSSGGKLQTWIAVGGFDFSDAGTATHNTWSLLVSTKANRAAFISSVKAYMDTYGFQGVDLDWEYPGDETRGGNKLADTRNFPLLVKEMRAAFGTAYGISVTLAPDYWYLRWFDAKSMESSVDFFGFMAYDLHGSWDTDVLTLGSIVRGQADIREIKSDTSPLWFDNLDPSKINFGLAMYGRGYTLSDPSCNQLLCPFSGPSNPAPCTHQAGVMSLVEIKQLIAQRGIEPQYLPDSMMKQITWDDQWIGYDDEETFAAKMAWADGLCFGGTMVWSIDFQEVGSGSDPDDPDGDGSPIVYIDPTIFVEPSPTIGCIPPCTFVFPPSPVVTPTIITPKPLTTSVVIGGSTVTLLSQEPVTVTVISFLTLSIPSGTTTSTFALTPVLQPPVISVTVGGTTTTILPPLITNPLPTTDATYTWPTLPTTVVTISGTAYTYSEDQITTMSDLPTQTTITTNFESSSSSTTTVVPFILWINSGGFYWSPVPGPTPIPGPDPIPIPKPPTFPSFPPIPSPPCFKFLDIFSIDCPPNHQNPTTHMISAKPSPTCKSKCGTIPGDPKPTSPPDPTDPEDPTNPPPEDVPCDLSDETGLCPNGNFPVWDPETISLNCDDDEEEATDDIIACQEDADEDLDDIKDLIECELDPDFCTPAKRSLHGRASSGCKRKRSPSYLDSPTPAEQALGCDTTFLCDTNKWPNVCLNAKSAQDLRGKPAHLTYYGEREKYGRDVTSDWYNTHPNLGKAKKSNTNSADMEAGTASAGSGSSKQNQPWGGWGLYGCEVEEYPWGNSLAPGTAPNPIAWADRSVLRLIPQKENAGHGATVAAMARYGEKNLKANFVYCVRITGPTPADYGLDAAQANNECGRAYGVPYILVNDIKDSEARALPNERRWDPWFDTQDQLFEHTIISIDPPAGQAGAAYIRTTAIPSQYGTAPSPGHKTYNLVNRGWTTVASSGQLIGKAVAREPANGDGTNLKWDAFGDVHTNANGQTVLKKRSNFKNRLQLPDKEFDLLKADNLDTTNSELNPANITGEVEVGDLLPGKVRRGLSARQMTSGSFLDPRVYSDILGCTLPEDDNCFVNLCNEGGVNFGIDDGQLKAGSPSNPDPSGGGGGNGGSTSALSSGQTSEPSPTTPPSGSITAPPTTAPPAPQNTNFISCSHRNQDPGLGITEAYCVCSGSTFDESVATYVTPYNSCGYTVLPSVTGGGDISLPVSTDTALCKVCTIVGHNNNVCTSLDNCTPTTTIAPPPPSATDRCITGHTYLYNDIFVGDGMGVMVWEDGQLICDVQANKVLASDETKWNWDCNNGAKVYVTDNGAYLEYTGGDGTTATIERTNGQHDIEDCYYNPRTDDPLHCSWFEYAFHNGNCAKCPVAGLCGSTDCKFNAACSS